MFSELRPYAHKEQVNLPWVDEVPAGWRVVRAKRLLAPIDVRSEEGTEDLLTVSSRRGVVRRSTAHVSMFQAKTYAGHKLCWPGDLVINSLWAWGRGLGVSPHHGIVSTAYGVYRSRRGETIRPGYLHAFVRSEPFQRELQVRSQGIWRSRLQLTDARFLDAPVLVPPTQEQDAILRYLGHAHRRIDRAITAKRKMISLLDEQEQAIIDAALTGRAEFGEPVRHKSGDGAVPRGGDWVRLGSLTSLIQTGPFGSQLHAGEYIEDGVPVVNPSHMVSGSIRPDPLVTVSEEKAAKLSRHRLVEGDLVVARRGELGRCALATGEQRGWVCGTGSVIVRPHQQRVLPEYLRLQFSSRSVRSQLELASVGSTMPNLNEKIVGRLTIPLPSMDGQRALLAFVDRNVGATNAVIDRAHREIQLLEEFRTRLTSDVVTGQLDVREIAARLPHIDPSDVTGEASGELEDDLADEAAEYLEAVDA